MITNALWGTISGGLLLIVVPNPKLMLFKINLTWMLRSFENLKLCLLDHVPLCLTQIKSGVQSSENLVPVINRPNIKYPPIFAIIKSMKIRSVF